MKYLLDTNILSEIGKPSPNPGVVKKLVEHQARSAVSAVTWHEFHYGIQRLTVGRKRSNLEKLAAQYANLPVLAYDEEVAIRHSIAKTQLERIGRPVPGADGQIAATAETHGLILVTRNEADFRHYPGLTLENWFSS